MHTTNNSLFQPDQKLPLSHVTEALQTLTCALEKLDMTCNWRNSPWIGYMGLELVDVTYKISLLTHKTSLNDEDNERVREILSTLSAWTAPACQEDYLAASTHSLQDLDLPPRRSVLLARAYWCACSYLATTLHNQIDNVENDNDNSDTKINTNAFVTETIALLTQLTQYGHATNNQLWPLVVIGTAATTLPLQTQITALLPRFNQSLGLESIKRAERFLAVAWKIDEVSGQMYGRRIFRDRDALYHMFF
jgi:hypothetical protein